MQLSRLEQETIINYNMEEKTANIYTHDPALIRRLEKLCAERPDECKPGYNQNEPRGKSYDVPKGWIKVSPKRILSEKQRAAANAALGKANLSRENAPCGKET